MIFLNYLIPLVLFSSLIKGNDLKRNPCISFSNSELGVTILHNTDDGSFLLLYKNLNITKPNNTLEIKLPKNHNMQLNELWKNKVIYIDEDYDYKKSDWIMTVVGSFEVNVLNKKGAGKLKNIYTDLTSKTKEKESK